MILSIALQEIKILVLSDYLTDTRTSDRTLGK